MVAAGWAGGRWLLAAGLLLVTSCWWLVGPQAAGPPVAHRWALVV